MKLFFLDFNSEFPLWWNLLIWFSKAFKRVNCFPQIVHILGNSVFLTEVINSRVVCSVYGQFWIWPFSLPFDTHNEIFWSPKYFGQISSGFGDISPSFKMPKMGQKFEKRWKISQFYLKILKVGLKNLVWTIFWWPKP